MKARSLSCSTSRKPRPVRLLFVSHSVPPAGASLSNIGGMQRVAADLYQALGEHPDVELDSLLLQTSQRMTALLTGPFLGRLLWQIPRAVRQYGIDAVLHSSMVTASVSVALQRQLRALGVRSAAIVHGRDVTLPNPAYQQLVPRVFDALDLVLPVSRATGEACLQRGLRPDKLHVIPNGIDIHRFPTLIDRAAARRRFLEAGFQLPDDVLLVCSVGRQVERKGFAWFIDQVLPGLPENVHYWLAGEGPEADRIRTLIAERNLAHRVRLLGRVTEEELHTLYCGADLFVMPNIPVPGDMEGFGVVMLEAGLCGLPTIAADLEGVRDVITPGQNGHLVESGNAAAFVEVIGSYLIDRDLIHRDGQRARAHVTDHFGWKHVANQYVQALHDLVQPTLSSIM